jgi:hypothetical protein
MLKGKTENNELVELARNVGAMNQQLIGIQTSMEKLDKKMNELTEQGKDILAIKLKQEQLEKSVIDLKNRNIDIELRISTLEGAEGKRAKGIMNRIGNYLLVAVLGAVVANIHSIIAVLGGK